MSHNVNKLSDSEIKKAIDNVPKLPSLGSLNKAIGSLFESENTIILDIVDIVQRDQVLTSRTLKLANSAAIGLSQKANSVEEAVLYLGLRQMKQLVLTSPIIEEFAKLNNTLPDINWKNVWKHSIGTGIMCRNILNSVNISVENETDYLIGLLHDIGKIVIVHAFQKHFEYLMTVFAETTELFSLFENEYLGWNHAQVGAYYLEIHNVNEEIVDSVRFHIETQKAKNKILANTIAVSDQILRNIGYYPLENVLSINYKTWDQFKEWNNLLEEIKNHNEKENCSIIFNEIVVKESINSSIERLPGILDVII